MNKYNSKCDIDVIHHARKSLLFDGYHTWIKKEGGLFHVSLCAYDGAEARELLETYLLNYYLKIKAKTNLDFIVMMDWPF